MLRKTLTSHVDAKAKIEEDIPAEAITAGACELNAFALRTELGDKHMAIINKILATHSEHILEFSDFLDSRYKSMMRELCKQPEDIEGTVNGVGRYPYAIAATRLHQRRRFGAVSGDAPAPRLAQVRPRSRSTLQT